MGQKAMFGVIFYIFFFSSMIHGNLMMEGKTMKKERKDKP
jgi:hypothetical protein